MPNSNESPHSRHPYLLLLHQLGVRAVVDDVLAKHRGSQNVVNLLGVDVLELAIEDEVIAGQAYCDGRLLSEEDKGEYIAVLIACQ